MTPSIDPVQFPRQIWQAVSNQARKTLSRKDFCPEQSRIENLRCVHLTEETDCSYGQQVWFFEAIGIDINQNRQILYGAIGLSVQYGILEVVQSALYQDIEQRQQFLLAETKLNQDSKVWSSPSTLFWVRTACAGVIAISMIWLLRLVSYLSS
jgi:hypothetical protein